MRVVVTAAIAAAAAGADLPAYDDFHYPKEEAAERASAPVPTFVSAAASSCTLSADGQQGKVQVGEKFGDWLLLASLPSAAPPACVLERTFARWGMLAFSFQGQPSWALRKAVGNLSAIVQPTFAFEPDYFSKVTASLEDLPTTLARNLTADGQMTFEAIAATLAPQRDIAEIGNPEDVAKFVVTYNGRVKCASYNGTLMNGITDFTSLHAALPNHQTVVFEPSDHLAYWPDRFENTKTGLVGGHFPIANVGSYSNSVSAGFELLAFTPVFQQTAQAGLGAPACTFTGPIKNTYVAGCTQQCRSFKALADAEAACAADASCGGVTLRGGGYQLRAGAAALPSPTNETSWLISNAGDCHAAPRIPGINYSPGAYVALSEEGGNATAGWRYWHVSNTTNVSVQAEEFYSEMLKQVVKTRQRLDGVMQVRVPYADRRQVDMSLSALVTSLSNFVGNQSNYGNGATYWSYGREDNGSLPLNVLTVDDALLDWGLCSTARDHLGFYFDNYVRADGTINYYSWGNLGDSVADWGRLIDIYLKVGRQCGDAGWMSTHLSKVEGLGRHLLDLRAEATAPGKHPPAGCKGLVQGAPEHDWSSDKDKYFFNNNAWLLRGMEMLGEHLATTGNATLGKLLRDDAVLMRADIAASAAAVSVNGSDGKPTFFPPYAEVGFKPFGSMTDSRTSEYSNFRFYSETLLSDVLPREIEGVMLEWHNNKGGRVGGASRFSKWLDDMPTAGWGYGALTGNRTDDFIALLYGHMATYQSRGTFHTTEQLSFTGSGLYRDFLHWPNPGADVAADSVKHAMYYAPENDVSFCIVSQILVPRLTRWQMVFEDYYRPGSGAVWLGRGAPSRWYTPASGGFGVSGVPTRFGRMGFDVTVPKAGTAIFSVQATGAPTGTVFKPRWPAAITNVTCQGCTILGFSDGVAAVASNVAEFSVTASF